MDNVDEIMDDIREEMETAYESSEAIGGVGRNVGVRKRWG